jgi:hypothetical protein
VPFRFSCVGRNRKKEGNQLALTDVQEDLADS